MSTERTHRRTLADWIGELVDACDLDPAGGGQRLRQVVGSRRARIALDDEVVEVSLVGSTFEITPAQRTVPVDGTGATSSATVLALLGGELEVSEAFHDGSIEATGHRQAVVRIFAAIEILLDASTRVPALRRLAADFRRQADRVPSNRRHFDAGRVEELALLSRLGLTGER
jgi:hypothetical protein